MQAGRDTRDTPVEALADVTAALEANDVPLAVSLATEAVANGAEHPLLLNLRAFRFESEGRDAEALTDLKRAAFLAPHDAVILNALGLAFFRCGQLSDAIQAFDTAITNAPAFSQAHFNKGWSLEESGNLVGARECFQRAHETQPEAAAPLGRLAALSVRRGEWDIARVKAEQALAKDSKNVMAIMALANIELEHGELGAAEHRLRELLTVSEIGTHDRATVEGLLGDVLHARNRSAEAFDAYTSCNDRFRRIYSARFAEAGIQTVPQYLEMLIDHFQCGTRDTWSRGEASAFQEADEPSRHVFIIGFPRSGTTLLEQVLGSQPGAVTSDEKDGLVEGVREFMTKPADLDRLAMLRRTGLARYRRAYWQHMRECGLETKGKIFIDKLPYHTVKLPLIAKLFPSARIVFMARDPRDVVLSCFRQRFRMNPSNYELLTLEGAAHLYDLTMQLAEIYRAKLPIAILDVRHEDLVADFEGRIRALCTFLELPWTDTMRDFAGRARKSAVATPSANQVAKGLYSSGASQWRRYADRLEPVMPVLKPWIERFGYEP